MPALLTTLGEAWGTGSAERVELKTICLKKSEPMIDSLLGRESFDAIVGVGPMPAPVHLVDLSAATGSVSWVIPLDVQGDKLHDVMAEAVAPDGFEIIDPGHGSAICMSNSPSFNDSFGAWAHIVGAPTMAEIATSDFFEKVIAPEARRKRDYQDIIAAFPAEARAEFQENADDELLRKERDMLDTMPLPHVTDKEDRRRSEWSKYSQNVRAAIRRMHAQFGHCPRDTLIQILRAAKVNPETIAAARVFRCKACDLS